MKQIRILFAAVAIVCASPAFSQQDISGTWSGMLAVSPDTSVEIHFVVTRQADGSYSTVLTSPNPDGIQNVPATSTSFAGNHLAIAVDGLSGHYEGDYADGRFTGNWTQQDTSIPLNLAPWVKPVFGDAEKAALRGSWVGQLVIPQGALAIVFRFEDKDDGGFAGFLDSPDQGANGIAISNIELQNGELKFRIPQIGGSYAGTVTGDSIKGTFTQGGNLPLNMTRGEYKPKSIELSQAAIDELKGSWVGKIQSPAAGTLTLVFRFETNADGKFEAFLDSPDQGASGIPITEVTLEEGKLTLVIPRAQVRYTATLANAEMQGSWSQGASSIPLTMARGEYTAPTVTLDLPAEAMQRLAGSWRGTMGPLDLIIRFETTSDGKPVAYLDVPAQGAKNVPIAKVTLDADQLTLGITAIGATYTGTLTGNSVAGNWQQGAATNALTLTRDP